MSEKKHRSFSFIVLCALALGAQTFTIKNLKEVPAMETYRLSATSTKYGKMPLFIKYESDGTTWNITSRMVMNGKKIDENYAIQLSNLLVTDSKRTISYDRGRVINTSKMEVDIQTDDPNEFLISTIPAIIYLLRTFPFVENEKSVNVRAPSQEKGHLNLRVKNKGLKKINTTKYGEIQAYQLEVAVRVPFIGGFLPKLSVYFKNDAQKTLVRLKGMMPGTGGKVDIELTQYEKK